MLKTYNKTMNDCLGVVKFAVNRIIDSVWTISYIEEKNGYAKILTYDRENVIGYVSERDLLKVELVETDKRIVEELLLYPRDCISCYGVKPIKRLKVSNQKHIFSY